MIPATALLLAISISSPQVALTPVEQLGKLLFFDTGLSTPPGTSCATCHDPATGFADPRLGFGTSQGAIHTRFGFRNAPTVAYASYSPPFRFLEGMGPMAMGIYEGGQNWDGIASTLVDQAKLPFVNRLEMNNPNPGKVVLKVRLGVYADLFLAVCGNDRSTDEAYECIAEALAAYQSSAEVNQFSSKYDHVLAGTAQLSEQEASGLALFRVSCARCHRHQPASDGTPPMFTSRHHANVGVPRNPENPFYGMPKGFNPAATDYVDPGTGGVVGDAFHFGRVKIPTLRNVTVTAPYMHNGTFPDLKTVVHFYNTRDVADWPEPEWNVAIIKAPENLGDLKLTSGQEDDIVAFLQTLTDGYTP